MIKWRKNSKIFKLLNRKKFKKIQLEDFRKKDKMLLNLTKKKNNYFSISNKYLFESKNFIYSDFYINVSNNILPQKSNYPHLVLKDSSGKNRFVLGYKIDKERKIIKIMNIQRVRNEYLLHDSKKGIARWSNFLETLKSNQLKRELSMHPSEFLMFELINKFKKEISNGELKLVFGVSKMSKKFPNANSLLHKKERNSMPIITRFFKKSSDFKNSGFYELSFNKSRVKQILDSN